MSLVNIPWQNGAVLLMLGVLLGGCGASTCEDPQTSVQGISTQDWMSQIYSNQDINLRDLVIPGTHDSGTYGITASSDVSLGSETWFYQFAKPVVAGWSKTQACNIAQQLDGGIRYLDLRLEWHKDQVWIVHGMFSDTLENVLQDIGTFSEAHPQEIVILDFQELTSVEYYGATHDLIQTQLSGQMLSSQWGAESTLHQLWDANEGNIIAVMNGSQMADLSEDYWYRGATLESDWANSGNADVVRAHVTNAIENRADGQFSVAQAVVTGNASSIIAGIFGGPNTLLKFNQPIADEINTWVAGWVDDGLPVNIVMTDFYDRTGVVQTIIETNIDAL
ncbi:hypothetical protein A9Q99_14260 [Gammaproteobacteria bacterium 45_16_T64]|nr:hypothetical protein A9Q99_14260 [Gammaproteobacteria bacterium 45_16_T64]